MTPSPSPSKLGLALRVGLYALIGWLSLMISATLMLWILGLRDTLFVIAALSTFAAAALANAITVRIYERGRLSDLGLGWTPTALREFLTGAGIAAGAATLIMVGPWAVGAAHFERAAASEHPWSSLILVNVVLLFGAAGEEMLFHGYAFQLLIRSLGAFATIFPTSVIFGLAHLGNQNTSKLAIFNTVLWGILLGYAYWRTKALWLPIGLHFGWNFALPMLGVNLSGFTMNVMGYALRWRAGDLWSGGGYGPEGSILTTGIVAVLFFGVYRVFPERIQE
jgi:membrane protease YdiL (CAAX protease family)